MTHRNAPIQNSPINTPFDVFLAYPRECLPLVIVVAEGLRRLGLKVWIDTEQVPPGSRFIDVIQDAIFRAKSAAVFIGPSGLGDWEAFELTAILSLCVKRKIPVIPVLLPGVEKVPDEYLLLAQLTWVSFEVHVYEEKALSDLRRGIESNNGL